MPTLYLPHGGGPWPWLNGNHRLAGGHDALRAWLEALPATLPPPKAILCVTAHWEAPEVTVSTHPSPPLLFDYYGFPPETYALTWPAPGAPGVAGRVRELLEAAGLPCASDADRGLDHGTFVPLAVAWPEADVPVVQLSLVDGLDPERHLAIGRALRPLRDEGVLLVGSGMSYHNLRGILGEARADSLVFDAWLASVVVDPSSRDAALAAWTEAPAARACHPREEHLLPLMVVAGASDGDRAHLPFHDDVLGVRVCAVQFDAA